MKNSTERPSDWHEFMRSMLNDDAYLDGYLEADLVMSTLLRLVHLRAEQQLTRKDVAKRMGMSTTGVEHFEAIDVGKHPLERIAAYAHALGYTPLVMFVPKCEARDFLIEHSADLDPERFLSWKQRQQGEE